MNRVTQLVSNKGRAVPNQFVLHMDNELLFQSYDSIIAKASGNTITLDVYYWAYSATTLKYLKQFLNTTCSKKEIQKKIENGEYLTGDLN
jgi:hypothetical protein